MYSCERSLRNSSLERIRAKDIMRGDGDGDGDGYGADLEVNVA